MKNDKVLLLRKIELDELVFKCKACTLSFARDHFLEYHIGRKHPELSKNYCKFCYLCSKNISQYRERVHGEVSEEDFTKEIDFKNLRFDCSLCHKKFFTENSAFFHKIVKHSDTTQCNLCLVDFKVSRNPTIALKQHFDIVHTIEELRVLNKPNKDQPFSCEKCNSKFLTKNILRHHLQYSHKEAKRRDLMCEVKHRNKMDNHRALTDKKYKCPLCYRLFASQKLWANHRHNVHRDEKELFSREICDTDLTEECKECLIKFVSLRSLNHHKVFAHEKRCEQNKCSLCYTKYSSKEKLQNHERLVHKTHQYEKHYDAANSYDT